jgi:dienelactone hydrolase
MSTPIESLIHQFNDNPRRMAFTADSPAGVETWQRALGSKLRELSGLDRMERWSFSVDVREGVSEDVGDHIRQKVELRTAPDYWMPFTVLIPKTDPPYVPIIAIHGHGRGMEDVVGVAPDEKALARIRQLNYDYGLQAVRRGYIVFAPDKRGFGERCDDDSTCATLATTALQVGMSVIGLHTWDNMRLIDWIQQRDDVRPGPVGCVGLSGGGGGTMWLSAMDARIGCAVISGHLANYDNGVFGCVCNVVPHLLQWADRGDIGGLLAPRPLLVESADNDQCFSRDATLAAYEVTKRAYEAAGVPNRIDIDLFEGHHEWHGTKAWPWLEHWLGR